MPISKPIHHLARQLQGDALIQQVQRFDSDALLVKPTTGEPIAIYLLEDCPLPHEIGQLLTQNSQQGVFSLLVLDGAWLADPPAGLQAVLSLLEIVYPHKAYVYTVLDEQLSILPVYLNWPDEQLAYYFAPPINPANLRVRTIDMDHWQWAVADFGPRPAYDPKEQFRRWKAKYDSGMGGRRNNTRHARPRRVYAARNHYEVLGVQAAATPDEIKHAYRRLARELHPDINSSPEAKRKMQQVNEAYHAITRHNQILRK